MVKICFLNHMQIQNSGISLASAEGKGHRLWRYLVKAFIRRKFCFVCKNSAEDFCVKFGGN